MFEKRSSEIEIMDDLNCAGEVVPQTLKELETINTWLGGNDVTLNALDKCMKQLKSTKLLQPIRIGDLGCGGGDILKLIAKKFRKNNIPAQLVGVDANPNIIEYAKKNTSGNPEITYASLDVFSEEFKQQQFDIVNCTLFCHHFDDEALKQLLMQLKQQTKFAIIINDLHRHWFAYHSIKWITYFFSRSYMVKNDAKLSVLRSFRKAELEKIIKDAGYTNFSIEWKWAFRYEILIYV